MARITQANLNAMVKRINRETGNPSTPYDGTKANVGHFMLEYAYGGVRLVQIDNAGGGARDAMDTGYVSKPALYDAMYAFLAGYNYGKLGVPS